MTSNTLPEKIVLASNNRKKVAELQVLLQPLGVEIVPQASLGVADAIEDGLSFVENALIKARHASKATGLPAIADDSGLAVDALMGAPGIYSARFAGEPSDDKANNALLLEKLQGMEESERGAAFYCALVFVMHHKDPVPLVCQAHWRGRILREARGENGFGYDPLFYVEEEGCTSAELSPERKSLVSHRGQAMELLLQALQTRFQL